MALSRDPAPLEATAGQGAAPESRSARSSTEMIAFVRLYALVDDRLARDHLRGVIELYGSRAAAERAMRGVLRDEPTWVSFVRVAEFPLVEVPTVQPSLN